MSTVDTDNPVWGSYRRWAVLLSFSFYSFSNAFVLMDFADDYGLAEQVLFNRTSGDSGDTQQIGFLYTLFLLCVMPAMFVAAWGVIHHNYATMAVAQVFNVLGTWLRYAAAQQQSYTMAVLSTVLAGTSASAIVCSYAVIAEGWFRPSQRALATTIAVQSNYAGWALGSLLGLLADGNAAFFADTILLWQAIVVSATIPLFLLGYRAPPPPACEEYAGLAGEGIVTIEAHGRTGLEADLLTSRTHDSPTRATLSVAQSMRHLFGNRKYFLRAICYAALGGIGFAVPAAQDVVFGATCAVNNTAWAGYDTTHTTFTNLSFILSGVLFGLLAGAVIRSPRNMETAVGQQLLNLTLPDPSDPT